MHVLRLVEHCLLESGPGTRWANDKLEIVLGPKSKGDIVFAGSGAEPRKKIPSASERRSNYAYLIHLIHRKIVFINLNAQQTSRALRRVAANCRVRDVA